MAYIDFFDYYPIDEYPKYMKRNGEKKKRYRILYRIIYNFVVRGEPVLDRCDEMINLYHEYKWYEENTTLNNKRGEMIFRSNKNDNDVDFSGDMINGANMLTYFIEECQCLDEKCRNTLKSMRTQDYKTRVY